MSNRELKKAAWPDFQTYMTEFKKKLSAEKNPCGEIIVPQYAEIHAPEPYPEPPKPQDLIEISTIGGATSYVPASYYTSGTIGSEGSFSGGTFTGRQISKENHYASSYDYDKAVLTAMEPENERLIIGEKYMVDDTNVPFDERELNCVHEHHNVFTLRAIDVDRVDYDQNYRINIILRCDHCGLSISMAVRIPGSAFQSKTVRIEYDRIIIDRRGDDRENNGVDQLLCLLSLNDPDEYDEEKSTDPNKLFAMMEGCPDE